MKRATRTAAVLLALAICGCARTRIEVTRPMPDGSIVTVIYDSDRDSSVGGMTYKRISECEGCTETVEFGVESASGIASTVEAQRWSTVEKLIDKIPVMP